MQAEANEIFWTEIRRTRNRFFLWWVLWPPGGIACIGLLMFLFGEQAVYLTYIVFVVWVIIWFRIAWQLARLACPRCRKPAVWHPYFFMPCSLPALWTRSNKGLLKRQSQRPDLSRLVPWNELPKWNDGLHASTPVPTPRANGERLQGSGPIAGRKSPPRLEHG